MIVLGMPCATAPVAAALNTAINDLLPTLLPSADFPTVRENARVRIQTILLESGLVPAGTEIGVFGSSRNNFGSNEADLDMCLILPILGQYSELIDKTETIEKIGEFLADKGNMLDVQVRSTARIPIVLFKDPVSGSKIVKSFMFRF